MSAKQQAEGLDMASMEAEGGLYDRVGFLIRRADQVATSNFSRYCGNLTRSQYGALRILAIVDSVDQRTLAEYLFLDRTTTGLVVQLLEKKGYVFREQDSADRRKRNVRLTPSGVHAIETIEKSAQQSQDELVSALTKSEVSTLKELLRKIIGE